MTITVNPEYNSVIDTAFCSNVLPVVWNGQIINSQGSYMSSLTTINGCDSIVTLNVSILTVNASATQVDILCFGNSTGSIDLTVTGGTGPYGYSWNTTPVQTTEDLSSLSAGSYTATITDATGCATTTSVILSQPASGMLASTIQVDVLCNGNATGSVDLTVTGGTGTYTYLWNTTPSQTTEDLSNLQAGTYTVTVTDQSNCTTSATVIITEPAAPLSATTTQVNVLCTGNSTGSIDLSVAGGTGPYVYSWSTTPVQITEDLSNLQAGSFTGSITDANGCSTTENVTITQPAVTLSANTTQVNVLCNSNSTGSIDLTVTGGTGPYGYSWNTTPVQTTEDLSSLSAGNYTATITDANGCTTTEGVIITEPTMLSAVLANQSNVTCFGGNNGSVIINPSGGVSPYSISPSQTNLTAGSYTFTVTDNNGCQFLVNAQILEPQSDLTVSIASQMNVSCNGLSDGAVSLLIAGGTAPYSTSPTTSNLPQGSYSFTVTDNNGCTFSVSTVITEPVLLTSQTTNTLITASGGSSTVTVSAAGGTSPYSGTGTFVETAGTYTYTVVDANGCSDVVTITITEPLSLTASSSATTILCNGGSSQITVTGNGGTSPYSGTGIFNVTAGTHTYTITDFYGNTANTTITVSEPSLLTSTSSAIPILCNGDFSAVTVSASGGVSPYTGIGVFNELAGSYTYSISDNNGCPTQTTITISEPNQINASASVVDVLCNNGFGSIDLTVSGGVGPYNILWNNTFNSEDLTNVIAGTYTAVVTDQNNCQETFIYSVVNSFAPTPILTNDSGTTILTCSNTSISYSITNANSVLWDGGQTPTSSTNTFVSPGQYILDIIDGNSCPIQFTINITQNNNLPNAGINTTPNITVLTCTNPSISVQAIGDGTYSWSNGLGTNANQILNQAGTYSVTVTSSNGCSSTSSITLTSDQSSPIAVITNNTGSTTLHCNQTQINVSASGGVSYQWSNGLGTNPNVNLNTAGTYTVTATASNGCTDTETIIINQSQNPTITVSSITICSGNSGTLTAVPSTPGGSYVWTQLPSNLVLPNVTASINVSPLSNAIYNVQYFDINNCPSNTVLSNVVVTPTPVVNVSGTTNICSGNNAVLTANSSLTGAGGYYTWSPNSATSQSVTVTPNITTTYSVNYTLNGCTSNAVNHLVTVNQTPTVVVNNIGICTGSQATLTAIPSVLGGTYSWNTSPTISTTQSITVQPSSTSTYTVVYTSTNNCPSQPVSGTVTVTDIPSVQLDDIFVCEGQIGTLTAIPSVPGGVFNWTPSNGSTGNTYDISPVMSTLVSVVYSLNDCSSLPDTAIVTFVNTPSVSVNDIIVCQNEIGTLTAIPNVSGGTYLWSTNETTVSINVNPQETTVYSVIYFLNGCPSPQSNVIVNIEPIPVIDFDVDFTEGCVPLTVTFTNATPNTANCIWNLGNGANFNECNELSFTFQNPGVFDVTLTTDSPNGCSNTLTFNDLITIYQNPIADFTVSSNILDVTDPTVTFNNNSSGAIDYIWNYGDNVYDSSIYNPEPHVYSGLLQSEYYIILTAISEYGCIDTAIQIIKLSDEETIYIPNSFTPDDDGLNEIWIPVITSGINQNSYELNIYNRWGELFFSTNDYLQGWDGTFRGNQVQHGMYTYQITYSKHNQTKKNTLVGHINLIR
jgi:gliding motility-associated-like protein